MNELQGQTAEVFSCFFVCFRLQIRLNEMLKENKDFKSTSSLMERKVDELTEENGILSSQVKTHKQLPHCWTQSFLVWRPSLTGESFLYP